MTASSFCVHGLGEAGYEIAASLARAGASVTAFDPAPGSTPPGVNRCGDQGEAVATASVVLALTGAAGAETALRQGLDSIPSGSLYADLSTTTPALKQRLAGIAAQASLAFADVALMGPVPRSGLKTPAVASGPGAEAFRRVMGPLGMTVEVVGDSAGTAAGHKLVRSILMKGLAASLIESMTAADALGISSPIWDDLVTEMTSMDESMMRRLVAGSEAHATRRIEEMTAVIGLLNDLGINPVISTAARSVLQDVESAGAPEVPAAETADQA